MNTMKRVLISLLTVGGVLLALGAIAAMIGIVVRITRESSREVVVAAHRDPAALRAESAEVYGDFDAAAWERGGTTWR